MLSKEQMSTIAVMIGTTADALANAISDEQEIKLELPEGRFLTKDNETKLLDNHGKRKYDEGKSKGSKETLETVKSKYELQGESFDDLFNAYKANVLKDAKIEPTEKLDQANKTIQSLKDSLKLKEDEIVKIKTDATAKEKRANALSSMPELRVDLGLNKSEALNTILSSIEQKEDGIYKGGQLVVNEHQEALSLNDFISQEVVERGWVQKKIQGNGGKRDGFKGSKPKTYSEFQKHCESKGWKESSLEAKEYLQSIKTDDFDMDN